MGPKIFSTNHQTLCQLREELSALLYVLYTEFEPLFETLSIYITWYCKDCFVCAVYKQGGEVYNIHQKFKLLEIGSILQREGKMYNIHEVLENPWMQMKNIRWSRLQIWRFSFSNWLRLTSYLSYAPHAGRSTWLTSPNRYVRKYFRSPLMLPTTCPHYSTSLSPRLTLSLNWGKLLLEPLFGTQMMGGLAQHYWDSFQNSKHFKLSKL